MNRDFVDQAERLAVVAIALAAQAAALLAEEEEEEGEGSGEEVGERTTCVVPSFRAAYKNMKRKQNLADRKHSP